MQIQIYNVTNFKSLYKIHNDKECAHSGGCFFVKMCIKRGPLVEEHQHSSFARIHYRLRNNKRCRKSYCQYFTEVRFLVIFSLR